MDRTIDGVMKMLFSFSSRFSTLDVINAYSLLTKSAKEREICMDMHVLPEISKHTGRI